MKKLIALIPIVVLLSGCASIPVKADCAGNHRPIAKIEVTRA